MKPIEIIEKIMEDHHLNASEFGEKVEKSSNYVAEIRSGKTAKISPPMVRKICRVFSEYNPDWVRTGEPPIYAAEVMSGNKAGGDILGHHATKSVGDELVAATAPLTEAARVNADTINKQAETIAQLLKNQQL